MTVVFYASEMEGVVWIKIYLVFAGPKVPAIPLDLGKVVTIDLCIDIHLECMWTQIRWEKYSAQPGLEPGTSG